MAEDSDNEDESGNNEEEPEEEEPEEEEPENEEPEKEEDSICEIFSRVFVNDSWSCASQVEKPYYSAGIYPDVCFECGSPEVTINVTKGEHPHCSGCGGNTSLSKKRIKWKQGGKDKGKRKIG